MKRVVAPPDWRRAAGVIALGALLFTLVLRLSSGGPVTPFLVFSGVLLIAALLGLPAAGFALGSLSGAYVAALLAADGGVDAGAPLFGVSLFVLAELLYLDRNQMEVISPESARARLWITGAFALGGFVLASVILVLGSSVALSGPLPLAAAGLLSALILGSILASSGSLLAPGSSRGQDR